MGWIPDAARSCSFSSHLVGGILLWTVNEKKGMEEEQRPVL